VRCQHHEDFHIGYLLSGLSDAYISAPGPGLLVYVVQQRPGVKFNAIDLSDRYIRFGPVGYGCGPRPRAMLLSGPATESAIPNAKSATHHITSKGGFGRLASIATSQASWAYQAMNAQTAVAIIVTSDAPVAGKYRHPGLIARHARAFDRQTRKSGIRRMASITAKMR